MLFFADLIKPSLTLAECAFGSKETSLPAVNLE